MCGMPAAPIAGNVIGRNFEIVRVSAEDSVVGVQD